MDADMIYTLYIQPLVLIGIFAFVFLMAELLSWAMEELE